MEFLVLALEAALVLHMSESFAYCTLGFGGMITIFGLMVVAAAVCATFCLRVLLSFVRLVAGLREGISIIVSTLLSRAAADSYILHYILQ